MPKDRRSSSLDRSRASPYSRCYKNTNKNRPKSPVLPIGNEPEWEEIKCPICMEHPHNAVLLNCSSREKGCHPYMCDTSSRHSNCLDQFQKSSINSEENKLSCPLCRGQVNGWTVVNPARQFMNNKTRSCSSGTCDFVGNYTELRKHARCDHPRVRPTEVDPARELEWRNLEGDLEQQDMLSMQFEFDDDDDFVIEEFTGRVSNLASPIWDPDLDFMQFLNTFESEFDSVFPEMDWASEDNTLLLDDWDNMFPFSSSPLSRGPTRSRNEFTVRRTENGPTTRTRNRTNTNQRLRSNSQPGSRNRQDQVTTLVDFHDLSSNLP